MEPNLQPPEWNVKLIENFKESKVEDNTIKAYITQKEVLINTETKIKNIVKQIEKESKEAMKELIKDDFQEEIFRDL